MATDGFIDRWDGVAYAAADERRLNSVNFMPGATAFSTRSGKRPGGGGLTVTVAGSPEAATVSPGAGVIFDANYAAHGPFAFEIPNARSVQLIARPSTGLRRLDLVIARIYATGVVGSVNEVKIEVIAGSPGSSPSKPSLPTLSIELATLDVPATGTISVTQATQSVVAAGGILPVATTEERAALAPHPGRTVFNQQTKRQEAYNGTDWVAQSQEIDSGAGSPYWGAVYNAATHQYKMHSQTVVGTPNVNGNILVANLAGHFAGVGAVVATLADSAATQSRGVISDLDGSILYARLFNSAGAFVNASVGSERVNVIIHGWV